MKLNKIYISAFGGLKDFTLDLNDGLNVIYGQNEDGKSTVATFIKTMFYGTGNSSTKIRQKYTPWDGSAMAGRIFFEHDGKKYCLERIFRKTDSSDNITLTDLDSGEKINTTKNLGQDFFGLSSAAFERSLFIGNGDFIKDDAAAGEINGKLSNIAFTGSEDVSYKKIEETILDTRHKLISKNGKSGSYNEDLQSLAELNNRLAAAENDAKLKSQLNDLAQQKLGEYDKLNKKYRELKLVVEKEQDIKNREKLIDFLDTKARLDDLAASLTLADGTTVNENLTGKIEFGLNKYKSALDRCDSINQDITRINEAIALQNSSPESTKQQLENLKTEVKALEEKKEKYTTDELSLTARVDELKAELIAAQNKKAAVNPLLLTLSIILAASGGACAFLVNSITAAAVIGVAAVLLTLSFIIRPTNTSAIAAAQNRLADANNALAETKASKNTTQEQINNVTASINTLNSVLQADNTIKQQRLDDLAKKQELLQTEQEKAAAAKDELLGYLAGVESIDTIESIEEKLQELKQKTTLLKEIKLQLRTASQYLGNIDYDDAAKKLESLNSGNDTDLDFDAVKAEYEELGEQISAIKNDITEIATELKTSFRKSENPEEIKREIAELQEKIDAKKSFCDAADLAIEVLQESFYELRRGYGSELEKATHQIFSRLTDGKYKTVNVTDKLELSVEESDSFGMHDLYHLSLGATHQAYLSLRLAITTLIGGDESLPIFLDDSLSQYDDNRTETAIKFLKEFCKNGQGILFTCHNAVCDLAQKYDVEIKKPYN